MAKVKSNKHKHTGLYGLAAWLPIKDSPHLYAFGNLIRNGYTEAQAYKIVKKALIASGEAVQKDFEELDAKFK